MLVKFVKATLENDMLPSVVKYECDKVHALISLSWFVKRYFKLNSCMCTCGYIYIYMLAVMHCWMMLLA